MADHSTTGSVGQRGSLGVVGKGNSKTAAIGHDYQSNIAMSGGRADLSWEFRLQANGAQAALSGIDY